MYAPSSKYSSIGLAGQVAWAIPFGSEHGSVTPWHSLSPLVWQIGLHTATFSLCVRARLCAYVCMCVSVCLCAPLSVCLCVCLGALMRISANCQASGHRNSQRGSTRCGQLPQVKELRPPAAERASALFSANFLLQQGSKPLLRTPFHPNEMIQLH